MSDLSWSVFPRVFFYYLHVLLHSKLVLHKILTTEQLYDIFYLIKLRITQKISASQAFYELLSLNQWFSILKTLTHTHSIHNDHILHYQKYDDLNLYTLHMCALTFVCPFFCLLDANVIFLMWYSLIWVGFTRKWHVNNVLKVALKASHTHTLGVFPPVSRSFV